jgi:hypothetical protein
MAQDLQARVVHRMRTRGIEPTPDLVQRVVARLAPPEPVEVLPPAPEDEGEGGLSNFIDVTQGAAASGTADLFNLLALPAEKVQDLLFGEGSDTFLPGLPSRGGLAGLYRGAAAESAQDPENQPAPGAEDTFWGENFPRAVGSSVPFLASSAIGGIGGLGAKGLGVLAGSQGALTEGYRGYQEALEATGNEGTAWSAFILQGATGSLEGLGAIAPMVGKLAPILMRGDKLTGGGFKRRLVETITKGGTVKKVARGALREGGTEFGQESGSDLIAEHFLQYREDARAVSQILKDAAWRAGAPGLALGGFFGGIEAAADRALQEGSGSTQGAPGSEVESDENAQGAGSQAAVPTDPAYQKVAGRAGATAEVPIPQSLGDLSEFARRRGRRLRGLQVDEDSTFRGAFDPESGDIFVNPARPREAVESTLTHEMLHALRDRHEGSWESLRAAVQTADPEGLARFEAVARKRQPDMDEALGTEEGMSYYGEEVLSPWMRALQRDPAKLETLARDNRGTFRKVIEAALDVLNALGAKFETHRARLRAVLGDAGAIARKMPPEKAMRLAREVISALDAMESDFQTRVQEAQAATEGHQKAQAERATRFEQERKALPEQAEPQVFSEQGIGPTPEGYTPGSARFSFSPPTREEFHEKVESSYAKFVDRLRPVMKWQAAGARVAAKAGVKLEESDDFILKERLRKSRTTDRQEHFQEKHEAPMEKARKAAGISVEEISDFLQFRHIGEREAAMEKINPGQAELAGWTAADKSAFAQKLAAMPASKRAALERVALMHDRMNRDVQDLRVKAGLSTQEEIDAQRAAYSNYTPLRDEMLEEVERIGSGISLYGPETKRALGRISKAGNSYIWSLVQGHSAVARAIKAETTEKALLSHIRKINDPTFARVLPSIPTMRAVVGGEVREVPDPVWHRRPGYLAVKENGKTVAIKFGEAHEHIAEILKGETSFVPGPVLSDIFELTRGLAALSTRHNPGFFVPNLVRDFGSAIIKGYAEQGPAFARDVLSGYYGAMRDLVRSATGKGVAKDLAEWRAAGGPIKSLDLVGYGRKLSDIEAATKDRGPIVDGLKAAVGWIDLVNDTIENASRFAAYRAARKRGMSPERAALLSKENTVNFETKGDMTPFFNGLWAFSNASVQGTRAIANALAHKRGWYAISALAMGAGVLDQMNRAVAGEDDDGINYYDKIPDFEKSRSLIFMGPGGRYAKIPLPYGWNWFFDLGRHASALSAGAEEAGEGAGELFSSLVQSTSPVGHGPFEQLVAPTLLDPAVQLATNKKFTGSPIRPESLPFGPEMADHSLYWKNTPEAWTKLAEGLSELTDADDSGQGALEVSPNSLQHFFQSMFGGAGEFVTGVIETGAGAREAHQAPIVDRVVGSVPPYSTDRKYREMSNEIESAKQRYDDLRKQGEGPRALAWRRSNMDLFRQIDRLEAAERRLRRIDNTPENEERRRALKARFLKAAQ